MKRCLVSLLALVAIFSLVAPARSAQVSENHTIETHFVVLNTDWRFFDVQQGLRSDGELSSSMVLSKTAETNDFLATLREMGDIRTVFKGSTAVSNTSNLPAHTTHPADWPADAIPFSTSVKTNHATLGEVKKKRSGNIVGTELETENLIEGQTVMGYVRYGSPNVLHVRLHFQNIDKIRERSLGQGAVIHEANEQEFNTSLTEHIEDGEMLVFSSTDLNQYLRTKKQDSWADWFGLGRSNKIGFVLFELKKQR